MSVLYKRSKNIFLLAIIVLSTIAGSLGLSHDTYAATPPPTLYLAPKVVTSAMTSISRVSLALCITIGGNHMNSPGGGPGNTVSADNIASGDWFYDKSEPNLRTGYLFDPANGEVQCRNLFKDHSIASNLAWQSNMELACGIGFVRLNKSDCLTGSGDLAESLTRDKIYTAIDKHVTNFTGKGDNGGPNGFNSIQYYVMAATTFTTTCGGKAVVNKSEANPDQLNNSDYQSVQIVDFSGKITPVLYKKDENGAKAFLNKEDTFDYVTEKCDVMAKYMNDYAAAYSKWVTANAPGTPGNPGTCEEAFKEKATEIKACQAGFAHKGDPAYCSVNYQPFPTPSPEYTACKYGQDTATAASGATAAPTPPDSSDDGGGNSCTVEAIGWIICPVVTFMAKVVDGAYAFVASLLVVQPLLTPANGADSGTIYGAWSIMRNFANVAFVIAFLLIIFSQLTSVGISNYGIKKMLPRLVVAAVLVNISYWICAIGVDLSNIVGGSINDVLKGITDNSIPGPSGGAFSGGGGGWQSIAGPLLAGTLVTIAFLYATLSALLPALIAALLAIVTVFLVLTIRQALIILLIVISPLAFVAYLLPNTESMFKKWRELFQTLLYMYPIIALMFGTSALASKVVMNSATGPYAIAIQIMGALVSIIPLALTPIVMKTAGSLLGKIGGNINNPTKGPFDRMRKGAEGYTGNRKELRRLGVLTGERRTLPGKRAIMRGGARREAVLSNRKNELNRANAAYIAKEAQDNPSFREKLAYGGSDGANMRALAGAITVQADLQAKEVKAASAVIEHLNLSSDNLNKLAMGGGASGTNLTGADDAVRKAAIQQAVGKGTVEDVEKLITGMNSDGTHIAGAQARDASQNKVLSDAIASSGIANKATHLGGQTIDDIAQGKVSTEADLDRVTARAIKNGKYAPEKLAQNDKNSLKRIEKVLSNPQDANLAENAAGNQLGESLTLDATNVTNMGTNATLLKNNLRLMSTTTNAQHPFINSIATHAGPPTPAPGPTPGGGPIPPPPSIP